MIIARLLIGLALASFTTAATAEWLPVATDSNGSVWMMDLDRISKVGGRMHAWVKVDASKDQSVKYRSSMRLYSSICASKKLRLISYVNYDSYGKVNGQDDASDSVYSDYGYSYVTPDSMGEAVLGVSCAVEEVRAQ